MEKIYQVVVIGPRREMTVIDFCNTEEQFKSMTVLQLKEKIRKKFPEIPGNVRMIFTDKDLNDDDRMLSNYGIQHMSVISLAEKLYQGGSPDDLCTEENSGMGDKTGKKISACHYNYPQQKECSKLPTIQNQMEKIYQVKVHHMFGGPLTIDLCSTSAEFNRLTVKDLKEKIVQKFSVRSESLKMMFDGWPLNDENSLLCDYGIRHLSAIILVFRVCGGGYPGYLPTEENSGMGDKNGKNISMERLCDFKTTGQCPAQKNSELCANSDKMCTVS